LYCCGLKPRHHAHLTHIQHHLEYKSLLCAFNPHTTPSGI
jgi:hypothetical protein